MAKVRQVNCYIMEMRWFYFIGENSGVAAAVCFRGVDVLRGDFRVEISGVRVLCRKMT